MSGRILVVGSGASGVHFAQSAIEKGYAVVMLDVGHPRPAAHAPELSFTGLKERLDDPVTYFLGEDYEGVLYPGHRGEYYGFPPSKQYVFRALARFALRTQGFAPLVSFAQGGLAEAWTGGSYPFNDAELQGFPFGYDRLGPYYGLIADRIGISGEADDLARFMPVHDHLQPPLRLDAHAASLLESYSRQRTTLNREFGCYLGRARTAVLGRDHRGRSACTYTGRCLWGCPTGAFYTPALTLAELQRSPRFTYLPNRYVTHLVLRGGRAAGAVCEPIGSGASETIEADRVVLAAGTLSSCRIFLESIYRDSGARPRLTGLMDNRQVLMPFLTLGRIREPFEADAYQYHQLALGLAADDPREYVHGLITTLKTALIHPIVQNVPLDLRTSLYLFRNVHAALALINVNFHDVRRDENSLALEPSPDGGHRLEVRYTPPAGEPERLRTATRTLKRVLRRLGCIVPPGMMHVRPMGASVHYAGTLPMQHEAAPLTTSPACESRDIPGLFFADGTTFPFLPAKNLTFTLMANAARIADEAF